MLCVKPFAKGSALGRLGLFGCVIASSVILAGHGQAENGPTGPGVEEAPLVQSIQIICSSQPDHGRSICPLPENPEQVELVSNISQAICVYGRNWGLEGEVLWTANGCSGRFNVTYGRAKPVMPMPLQPENQFLLPEPGTKPFRREA